MAIVRRSAEPTIPTAVNAFIDFGLTPN